MRAILVLLTALVIASPAQACLGPEMETSIFFPAAPIEFKADVVAKVAIYFRKRDEATNITTVDAMVMDAISGKVKSGQRMKLQFSENSCGPKDGLGGNGIIAANYARDGKGLVPYTRRAGDGKYFPPSR